MRCSIIVLLLDMQCCTRWQGLMCDSVIKRLIDAINLSVVQYMLFSRK